MVEGIESFKTHFADFTDRYVLIGGTASSLAMEELGVEFRGTKDLDIVLCIEALDKVFAQQFWEYVKAGGYEHRQKSTGKRLFYRFYKPKNPEFPEMLELFSRVPDALQIADDSQLTPIPVEDEVSSLSAILLDDAYYHLIHERKREIDGLTIIGPECLIPLKARAYTDLRERKEAGEKIDSKDIKKHKNDIFRLYTILDLSMKMGIAETIRTDLSQAFERLRDDAVDLKALGVPGTTVPEILKELEAFYEL
ncbi:MAG: hypothetical protein LAT55_06975 [Opitutales bacterium]|nr:hypothetical protein [Opitutales bacterium]